MKGLGTAVVYKKSSSLERDQSILLAEGVEIRLHGDFWIGLCVFNESSALAEELEGGNFIGDLRVSAGDLLVGLLNKGAGKYLRSLHDPEVFPGDRLGGDSLRR